MQRTSIAQSSTFIATEDTRLYWIVVGFRRVVNLNENNDAIEHGRYEIIEQLFTKGKPVIVYWSEVLVNHPDEYEIINLLRSN